MGKLLQTLQKRAPAREYEAYGEVMRRDARACANSFRASLFDIDRTVSMPLSFAVMDCVDCWV